jgi:hypothetical protein
METYDVTIDQVPTRPRVNRAQHIHTRLDELCADLARPPPLVSPDIPLPVLTPDETTIHLMYLSTEPRGLPSANAQRLKAYFVLGRALDQLGTRQAKRMLRQYATPSRVNHVYVVALRCFELFKIRGIEYMGVVGKITPGTLDSMHKDDFRTLCEYARSLKHLEDQVSSAGDDVAFY